MAEPLAASRLPRRRVALATRAHESDEGVLGSRLLAYAIDSLLVAIFAMAFVGLGALILLLSTDGGFNDVSDSALWLFVYISLASIPAWLIALLVLLRRNGQTVGQYVIGVAVVREDGGRPSFAQLILYALALHPLLFHPVLGLFWALAALVSIPRVSSNLVLIGFAALAVLCAVAPLAALVTAATDGGRRALHDRVGALKVVRLE